MAISLTLPLGDWSKMLSEAMAVSHIKKDGGKFNYFLQKVICPEVLHEDVIVVKGRLVLVQDDSEIQRPENCKIVTGSTGEKVCLKCGRLS